MVEYDVAIIGGGIFGCSIAKHLSEKSDLSLCVLEKEYHLAQHQSGRNSGTLHLGVVTEADIKPGTQLAEFTIEGSRRLKDYCREHDLPILERGIMKAGTGKEQREKVEKLYESAAQSGVNVELLESQEEIHEIEPNITGDIALYSPESATVDTGPITHKLAQQAYDNGADFYMGCKVSEINERNERTHVRTNKTDIDADYVINAAGVKALDLANMMGVGSEYHAIPFRGVYFELVPEKRHLVNTNVYPTIVGPSFQVGVHFTRRPDNRVIVGPTGMIALGSETYGKTEFNIKEILKTVSSRSFWNFIGSKETMKLAWNELNKTYRKKEFLQHCRKLIPDIQSEDIEESYVGISHWLFDRSGQRVDDAVIEIDDRSAHLLMPQPGFTSALTTGDYVSDKVLKQVSH
ncbi:NAD(P)/FAD-dependent oxidoreductase [Halorarius halobius]|uniref:NAD(P)/FAD-dependent oxidoreductase n=1 Tax=Halorarius halobius TaxID=2962671 RepID=UPI0020CE51AA|nr:FAD-dependent oxidoreductase [Halorarius halobius]